MAGQGAAPPRSTKATTTKPPPAKGPSKPAPAAQLQRTASAISRAAAQAGPGGSKRR